jgi:hypothetical protein
MRLQERLKREYRLLALAVVFFAAGVIFFWYDSSLSPSSKSAPAPAGSPQSATAGLGVAGERGGATLDPDFSKYPAPAQFKTFTYGKNGINGSPALSISTTCNDAYVAVLIFPSAIDYRGDINAAIYNDAFPCRAGQSFTTTVATSDIATAPFGTYYYFVADQGTAGTWYNPR